MEEVCFPTRCSSKIQAFYHVEQWSWTAGCFEERRWLRHYASSIPSPLRTFLSMNKTWITAILKLHFLICKSCCADVCFPSLSSFFFFSTFVSVFREIELPWRKLKHSSEMKYCVFLKVHHLPPLRCFHQGFCSFHVCLWQNFVKTFKRLLSTLTVLQMSFLPDGLQKQEQLG